MHTQPIPESAGTFREPDACKFNCRFCDGVKTVTCKTWESSCGGYEDDKYTCAKCGKSWWVDGADS